METTLKNLIESTLNVPCYIDADTITFPSATLELYQETPVLFGDGKAKVIESNIQLDLWYTDRTTRDTAVASVVPLIVNEGFTYPTIDKIYDTTAKKFRATLKFSKTERS